MANLNVTYDELNQAATRLGAGKDDLTAKLNELQSLVHQLTASGFQTDQASGAFRDSYDQFTKGTTQAVDGLDGMQTFLTKAAQALQNVDQSLAQGIGG
jgi:WXG100 family type VII secretion target